MKTTFLKIAIVLLLITAAIKTFAADFLKTSEYTELAWITNFSKIEVHGNVHLHLLSGHKNKVEVKGTYFDHNALIQVDQGIMRITCYRIQRLDVWVTANNLSALSAYDNVLVQTEGKFSDLELNVELFNHAKADLDLDSYSAFISLHDRSVADVSGTAMESEMVSNYASTLNSVKFIAGQISKQRIDPIWETRIEFVGFRNTDWTNEQLPDSARELRFSSAIKKQIKLNIPREVDRINITRILMN